MRGNKNVFKKVQYFLTKMIFFKGYETKNINKHLFKFIIEFVRIQILS